MGNLDSKSLGPRWWPWGLPGFHRASTGCSRLQQARGPVMCCTQRSLADGELTPPSVPSLSLPVDLPACKCRCQPEPGMLLVSVFVLMDSREEAVVKPYHSSLASLD